MYKINLNAAEKRTLKLKLIKVVYSS